MVYFYHSRMRSEGIRYIGYVPEMGVELSDEKFEMRSRGECGRVPGLYKVGNCGSS